MKIMVCYDGSKEAKAALRQAHEHAKVWNADLLAVHSISRELALKRSRIEKTEKELGDQIKALFEDDDIPCEVQLIVASPDVGEQLVEFAEDEEADIIFIGVVVKSKVRKLLMGSTAQYVILNAPCPVVTVQSHMVTVRSQSKK